MTLDWASTVSAALLRSGALARWLLFSLVRVAPAGYHDDCVMALALANHRRWETESCGRMLILGGSVRRKVTMEARRERGLLV